MTLNTKLHLTTTAAATPNRPLLDGGTFAFYRSQGLQACYDAPGSCAGVVADPWWGPPLGGSYGGTGRLPALTVSWWFNLRKVLLWSFSRSCCGCLLLQGPRGMASSFAAPLGNVRLLATGLSQGRPFGQSPLLQLLKSEAALVTLVAGLLVAVYLYLNRWVGRQHGVFSWQPAFPASSSSSSINSSSNAGVALTLHWRYSGMTEVAAAVVALFDERPADNKAATLVVHACCPPAPTTAAVYVNTGTARAH